MNELSDSVDCFDKISARAFPQDYLDFSDGEFTVSDLENVTGRKRKLPALKWAAIGAAAAVCIAFVPKTGLADRLFANLGSSSGKNRFRSLCTEITELNKEEELYFFDVDLDVYAKYDVLVTPGVSCPFEESGEEGTMVRVFVRTVEGVPTNQYYAVEYEGTYAEENIIAAAASEVTISKEEAARIEEAEPVFTYDEPLLTETVRDHFIASGSGSLLDAEGKDTAVASYSHNAFFKDENGIRPVTMTVLYGHRNIPADESYFYDICASSGSGNSFVQQEDIWRASLYYNGRSAKPEKSASLFTYTSLFGSDIEQNGDTWAYVFPYSAVNGRVTVKGHAEKTGYDLVSAAKGNYGFIVPAPYGDQDGLSMRLFFDPALLGSIDDSIEVYSSVMSSPALFSSSDASADDITMAKWEEEAAQAEFDEEQQRLQAEIEAQRRAAAQQTAADQHLQEKRANEALIAQVLSAKEEELSRLDPSAKG
ncbi:MAG: hypothetical protein IJ071_01320 [Ruminococcus sp.]|nr:hypothetical protein [Ruminococcus sp.]